MGHQIIKQPNGNYAVWSTIVTDFVVIDATPEEIIQIWIEDESEKIREQVMKTVGKLERGEKPYYQFTMDWKEALKTRDEFHGKKDREFDDQGKIRKTKSGKS